MSNEWDRNKHGVDPDAAKAAQQGINKPASEVLKEEWNKIKEVFTPSVRSNELKENKKRTNGGYYGR
jgi:hypothetical protein